MSGVSVTHFKILISFLTITAQIHFTIFKWLIKGFYICTRFCCPVENVLKQTYMQVVYPQYQVFHNLAETMPLLPGLKMIPVITPWVIQNIWFTNNNKMSNSLTIYSRDLIFTACSDAKTVLFWCSEITMKWTQLLLYMENTLLYPDDKWHTFPTLHKSELELKKGWLREWIANGAERHQWEV